MKWLGFIALTLLLVSLDLWVFRRKSEKRSLAVVLGWSGFWISLALAFNVFVYFLYGGGDKGWEAALQFFTGYVIEKSLSLDNIFVISLIFVSYRIPEELQHRVLTWGILGAVALRTIMTIGGVALVNQLSWVLYVFGAFLFLTALQFLFMKREQKVQEAFIVKFAKRFFPVTSNFSGNDFFIWEHGKRVATSLFLALLQIESADVIFAVDSIPAIFAVTNDPFIILTSNIFAIFGLRALYFVLSGLLGVFRYLKVSLALILAFIGLKMLSAPWIEISTPLSLGILFFILLGGILASLLLKKAR